MRIFFAITFINETLKDIENHRNQILKKATEGKPVPTNNFHITLEYVGEIDSKEIHKYKKVLNKLKLKPLYLTATQYGSFSRRGKHIIWLRIKYSNKLKQLVLQLKNRLKTFNYPKSENSNYIPHITLGRKVKLSESLSRISLEPFKLTIKSIALLESVSSDNKTVYKTIHERLL